MKNTSIFQTALPHIAAVIIFLAVACIYFSPQLSGKQIQAGDTTSFITSSKEIKDFKKETGETTLWTNSMFGGMPAYQISVQHPNALKYVEKTSNLFIPRPIGYFFAMMLGFYVLMILLGVNSWLSIIGAIAFSITTNNLVLFGAGHMSKIRVFAYFGIIFAGVVLAFRKKYLTGGILFALGLGVSLYANHVQMIYYFFLFLGIYGLIELILHAQRGGLPDFGKSVLYLGVWGLLALAANTSNLWTTYEYAKDTMRGTPILVKAANAEETSSNTEGLDWKYAMQYSNNWLDLASSFIPGVVGGGAGEPVGKNSAFATDIRKRGGNPRKDLRAPLYWGAVGKNMSTAGPVYFGAAVFFLFILGMFVVKGSIKWGIGAGVLLTMLLSLGDGFEFFNRLMFDYFPLYNKFRTPNSVLAITSFLIPVLGTLAVSEFLKGKTSKEKLLRSLYIATGIMGGICLFFALLGGSFFEFTNPLRDAGYVNNYNYSLEALQADRASLMRSDALRSLALILATAGLLWAFLTDKIKSNILLAGIAVITIGDLWTVGKRYLGADKFTTPNKVESYKNPRQVDTEILKDNDPNFRVHDLTINAFNSSSTSYFHKTIGGYHPAKLQRYQDLIERNIQPEDAALRRGLSNAQSLADITPIFQSMPVMNMLNTKYFIANPKGAPLRNPSALGNAWFVNNIRTVNSANEEIDALKGLNPSETAIVHQEFSDYVGGYNVQKNGTIQLTSYAPNKLTYKTNATSDQLAVFSEIWYGPNKGWQAYLDGNPVDHIRANYALRAMKVPAGEHTIEFEFVPSTFSLGTKISLFASLAILLAFLWVVGKRLLLYMNNEGSDAIAAEEKTVQKSTKKPLKKTTSKKKKK